MKTGAFPLLLAETATFIYRWIASDFSCKIMSRIYTGQLDPEHFDEKLDKVVLEYNSRHEAREMENKPHFLYAFLQEMKSYTVCASLEVVRCYLSLSF